MTIETPVQYTVTAAKIWLLKMLLADIRDRVPPEQFEETIWDYAQDELRNLVLQWERGNDDYEQRTRQGDPSKLAGK